MILLNWLISLYGFATKQLLSHTVILAIANIRIYSTLLISTALNENITDLLFKALHTFVCRLLCALTIQKWCNEAVCHRLPSEWFGFFRLGIIFQTCQGKWFLYNDQKSPETGQ